ncbi:hypothetical protein AJ87_49180 [Rhizobium yanglingense]|nr:hypothetical protein AJ87_49180 [Rhizobium yanglingense]
MNKVVHSRLEGLGAKPTHHTPIRMKSDELTCLRWSAEGKSMKAIAIIDNTTCSKCRVFSSQREIGPWSDELAASDRDGQGVRPDLSLPLRSRHFRYIA